MRKILKSTLGVVLTCVVGSSCATTEETYAENTFSRTEIARMNAAFFDVNAHGASAALKPVYGKYGAPHIFVKGFMSAVYDSDDDKLFGTGTGNPKFGLATDVYWEIEGQNVVDLFKPIKTAHLIYEKEQLPFGTDYSNIGALSDRGQVFTIFEREIDGKIIVTLNQSADLPNDSKFRKLMMRVSLH